MMIAELDEQRRPIGGEQEFVQVRDGLAGAVQTIQIRREIAIDAVAQRRRAARESRRLSFNCM